MNKINIALVGQGRELSNMLAGLATRSNSLRLNIVAVIDLSPDLVSEARDHAQSIGIPLITNQLDDLHQLEDLNLIVATKGVDEALVKMRASFADNVAVMGPEIHEVIEGLVRLVDANQLLRADSRRLKEARLRLNLFTDTAPLAIYVKDTDLRYLKMNAHALKMLGIKEEEVLGKRDRTIYPDRSARWLQKVEQETLRHRKTFHASGILPIQGQDMHVHVTLFPIIENGKIDGLYGLIEDTTELYESERKFHRVDEQLNETQKYLREVLENSRDIIFLTDPMGNMLSFNSGAETVLAYNRDQMIGTPAKRLFSNPSVFNKLFEEALRDGHAQTYETEFLTSNNDAVVVNISLTRIEGPDGTPLELVCICRDITTRLRLKEDLIRSERLAAVGQMASGVAHEINNPLAVIDTIAGMVEETLVEEGDSLEPETKKVLAQAMERLHHQVARVTTITHSLLGFVRTSNSGMTEVNIVALLEECLAVLGTEIRRSQTDVRTMFAQELPRFVSDPLLLEQVFVNLISNAIDAISEAPGRRGVLEILVTRDEDRLRITFQDNGVGIAKEDLEKIFNLFHTTKPAGKGTGL
ncbi:MAG: PAS domain S-box-containing protein, partial [Candidatus Krumholzibacteriia bacterium]